MIFGTSLRRLLLSGGIFLLASGLAGGCPPIFPEDPDGNPPTANENENSEQPGNANSAPDPTDNGNANGGANTNANAAPPPANGNDNASENGNSNGGGNENENGAAPPPPLMLAPADNLRLFRTAAPSQPELRWDFGDSDIAPASFIVLDAPAPLTEAEPAAIVAEVAADQRSALVEIESDSGVHFLYVAAVDADGELGPLSPAFEVETATRVTVGSNKDREDARELFLATPAGGTPLKISGSIVPFSQAGQPVWSPDGRHVAFISDRGRLGTFELFVNRPNGVDEPFKVSGAAGLIGSTVFGMQWSPNGQQLAYASNRNDLNSIRSYVTDATPNAMPVELGAELAPNGVVVFAGWLRSGRQVLVLVDANKDNRLESVFRIATDGTEEPQELAFAIAADEDFSFFPGLSPDEQWVAFTSDRLTDGVSELFAAPADGSLPPQRINHPLPVGGEVRNAIWAPDSSLLAYIGTNADDESGEVFVVAPDGIGGATPVSGAAPGRFGATDLAWSPDSKMLAFLTDKRVSTRREAYVATIGVGGEPAIVGGDPIGRGCRGLEWSPTGTRLAFLAEIDATNFEVCRVTPPVNGAVPVSVSIASQTDGVDVSPIDFEWAADGSFISFHGTLGGGVPQMWIAPFDGSAPPLPIGGNLPAGRAASFGSAKWSPIGF